MGAGRCGECGGRGREERLKEKRKKEKERKGRKIKRKHDMVGWREKIRKTGKQKENSAVMVRC